MLHASLPLVLAVSIFAASTRAQDADTRRPNILLIVADDLGVMDVGANNPATFYATPRLDALAASGVRFTDGYATCPVCSPSRYSLMTGRYPARAPLTDWLKGQRRGRFVPATYLDRMPVAEVTVAEALREAGYATFFAGKWHLGPDEADWPEHHGFDANVAGWKSGSPGKPGRYFPPYGNPRLEDGPEGEHLPLRLAAETSAWIRGRRAASPDQPFFATLSFYSVHTPLMAPEDAVADWKQKRADVDADAPRFAAEEQTLPTDRERKVRVVQDHAVYAAMLEAMDTAVGEVLDTLDALEISEDTIVVFTSDNGGLSTSEGSPTSNLPYRGGKGWSYEGGIRVPFFVRWPGVAAPGTTSAVPVTGADLYPTFLAAAGAAARPAQHQDGVDLSTAIAGKAKGADRPLFWHYPHYGNQGGFPAGVIRRGKWKLLLRYEDGRHHLYDLAADPGERDDRAEAEPDRAAALRAELLAWLEAADARFLRPRKRETGVVGPSPWLPEFAKK